MPDLECTQLRLRIGSATNPRAAPALLVDSLRSIEVIQTSQSPSGFQMIFEAERYAEQPGQSSEYPLLSTGLLDPFNRLQVETTMGNTKQLLIDGFITHQAVATDERSLVITVTGEDLSVKMDLFQVSAEYPKMADSAIVKKILGKYSGLGIQLKVTAPNGEKAPEDYVPQQNGTDRRYLQELAARNGFRFYVGPDPKSGKVNAYWGPRNVDGTVQKALTTNMGEEDNILTLEMSFDALVPTVAYGSVLDMTSTPAKATDIGVAKSSAKPPFAKQSSIPSGQATPPTGAVANAPKLAVRGSLLYHPGLDVLTAKSRGQAMVDLAVEQVITVKGTVDTVAYEAILQATQVVELRGVGTSYDGRYYVEEVTHKLDLEAGDWEYEQGFKLSRSGLGSTISKVQQA